jgi:hypothetical protein
MLLRISYLNIKMIKKRFIYLFTLILLSGFLSTTFAMELQLGQDTISLEKESVEPGDYDEEVYIEELPESVKASVDEAYNGYELSRAFKNKEGNFRIELENGNEKAIVYYDMTGKFIKAEDNNNASSMQDL